MVSTKAERALDDQHVELSEGPVAPWNRIEAIDVLRGLALFGVLAINIVFEFRVSIFEQFLPPAQTTPAIESALRDVLAIAIESKALALFSFLFGVGLAIQFERLAKNPRRAALLTRRLVVLLAIGGAHLLLVWNGDILVEYALAGLVVLPILFGPRWLAPVAAAAALLLFLTMPLLPDVVQFPSQLWIKNHIAEAATAYGEGGLWDVIVFRVHEIPAIFPLHVLVFPRTVSLFLFGAVAWRCGILLRDYQNRTLVFGIATAGLLLGGSLAIASHGRAFFGWPSLGRAGEVIDRVAGVTLALGYAATVIVLMGIPVWRTTLARLAPVGRMALTNYLCQSLVLAWLFYGYGLGLFGRLSVTAAFTIGVLLYVVQVFISAWWLARYRYGPVEWLWRSLMYGARQPMV